MQFVLWPCVTAALTCVSAPPILPSTIARTTAPMAPAQRNCRSNGHTEVVSCTSQEAFCRSSCVVDPACVAYGWMVQNTYNCSNTGYCVHHNSDAKDLVWINGAREPIIQGIQCNRVLPLTSAHVACVTSFCNGFKQGATAQCAPSTFLKGLYRSAGSSHSVDLLGAGSCCRMPQAESIAVTVTPFNMAPNTWSLCDVGFFISGLHRSDEEGLVSIQGATCAHPTNLPLQYRSCFELLPDPSHAWTDEGWIECGGHHYMVGLRVSSRPGLDGIMVIKCCAPMDVQCGTLPMGSFVTLSEHCTIAPCQVVQSCIADFESPDDGAVRSCQASGQWSGIQLSCTLKAPLVPCTSLLPPSTFNNIVSRVGEGPCSNTNSLSSESICEEGACLRSCAMDVRCVGALLAPLTAEPCGCLNYRSTHADGINCVTGSTPCAFPVTYEGVDHSDCFTRMDKDNDTVGCFTNHTQTAPDSPWGTCSCQAATVQVTVSAADHSCYRKLAMVDNSHSCSNALCDGFHQGASASCDAGLYLRAVHRRKGLSQNLALMSGYCCTIPQALDSTTQLVLWGTTIASAGVWSTCPIGWFLFELRRGEDTLGLDSLTSVLCARPENLAEAYEDCFVISAGPSGWISEGWLDCGGDHFLVGLLRGPGTDLDSIAAVQCCAPLKVPCVTFAAAGQLCDVSRGRCCQDDYVCTAASNTCMVRQSLFTDTPIAPASSRETPVEWLSPTFLLLFVMVGLSLLMTILYCLARALSAQDANLLAHITTTLRCFDLVTDILFVSGLEPTHQLFIPAVTFLVVPSAISLVVAVYLINLELANKRFFEWVQQRQGLVAVFAVLSVSGSDVLALMSSRLFRLTSLSAPRSPKMEMAVDMSGVISNVLEDIPQLFIQLLFAAASPPSIFLTLSLSATTFSILFAMLRRLVRFLVVRNFTRHHSEAVRPSATPCDVRSI